MIEERYELALDRIRLMQTEDTVGEPYRDYFKKMAEFVLMLDELRTELLDGRYQKLELDELRKWNRRLYQDVLPGQYEKSYANPDYACKMLGKESGQILGMLYAELRGAVVYVFEGKTEYLAILYELLIEVYNQFEEEPDPKAVRDTFYWYASDYCDVFLAERIREQVLPEESFATDLIMNSDLTDLRYLYQFGEYISENEWKTAEHLNSLPEETIRKMADVYTEGYRIGFVNTGKDLSKKSVVNIRYILGFERVVKKAIENFEKMGLKPVIYRAAVSVLTKRQHIKIGYYGAVANKQYEYDHKDDQALFMDKKYLERKLEVMQTTYEHHKKEAAGFAGPACIDMFGEEPFEPEAKETVAKLSKSQEEMILQYDSRQSQMVNQYIKGEERSFTIIAYPVPEIGDLVTMTDGGEKKFVGIVLQRSLGSEDSTMAFTAFDYGYYLQRNDGTYKFTGATPEEMTRLACADRGIPIAQMPHTGIPLRRKFTGVKLNQLITTAWTLASEKNGKVYAIRYTPAGLLVKERTVSTSSLVLKAASNLMNATTKEDATQMVNIVAIYDQNGNFLRRMGDSEAQKLCGVMEQHVTQGNDGAARADASAKKILADGKLQKTVTVNVLGDMSLLTGETVVVREGKTGLTGIFWIDADVHTWKNKNYYTKLTLNCRNVMATADAGSEVK